MLKLMKMDYCKNKGNKKLIAVIVVDPKEKLVEEYIFEMKI